MTCSTLSWSMSAGTSRADFQRLEQLADCPEGVSLDWIGLTRHTDDVLLSVLEFDVGTFIIVKVERSR